MGKLLLVCALLSIFAGAFAELKCYNCTAKTCDEKTTLTCGKSLIAGDLQPACMKYVYKDAKSETHTARSCVIEQKGKKFQCIGAPPGQTVTEEFCGLCYENLCNGGDGYKINIFNVLTATLCSLLAIKFFL